MSSSREADGNDLFLKHSLLLGVIMGVANLANILFHVAMGRMLTPADYGVLMSMYGLLYVLNVPAETLRTAMAYHSAARESAGLESGFATALFFQAARRLLLLAGPFLIIVALISPWLCAFFQLEGPGPVIAAALVCLATLLMTALHGVLQGRQNFAWYGVSCGLWFGGRLVLAVLLVYWGLRATGALFGMMGGALLAVALPSVLLRRGLSSARGVGKVDSRPIYLYFGKVLVIYAGCMYLGNIDILAVKHYFPPEDAGLFSQAALLAHFVWLLPYPIMLAMFPKVVRRRAQGRSTLPLLFKSLAMCAGLLILLCTVLLWRPDLLFGLLFGRAAHPLIPLMPLFVGAMLPLALMIVLLNYEMASGRFRVSMPIMAGAIITTIVLALWHGSLREMIGMLCRLNWLNLALVSIGCLRGYRAESRAPANGKS